MVINFAESHCQLFFFNELIQLSAHTCSGVTLSTRLDLGRVRSSPVDHPLLNGDHQVTELEGRLMEAGCARTTMPGR